MLTGAIWKVCNEFFPDDAIVALDGGNTTMWSMNYMLPKRQRSVLYTHNMGFLGTGLPFAVGASLVAPDRRVYCVTGDSAFGFNIQELETIPAGRFETPEDVADVCLFLASHRSDYVVGHTLPVTGGR